MKSSITAAAVVITTVAATAAMTASAPAQNWPTHPMTMVVTFAAGSGDDLMARIVAPRMSEVLGQQIVIENVGGAGGMNGVNRVAKAAPDGYQMVMGGTGTFGANQTLYKNPLYNAVTDFKPVALIVEQPMALVTRSDLPVKDLQEFIAYTKAHRAEMQFGSGGAGSGTHLACVLLNTAIGVDVTHVPYRSTVFAMQDIIGGRVDYACPIASTAISIIRNKQLKPIAILSRDRAPILPDLPTAREQGLTDLDANIWNGLFLPKDTPDSIVEKLHDAAVEAMNTPAVQQQIRKMGGLVVAPERRSIAYLRQFVRDEIKKWAVPIKASGLSID